MIIHSHSKKSFICIDRNTNFCVAFLGDIQEISEVEAVIRSLKVTKAYVISSNGNTSDLEAHGWRPSKDNNILEKK